MPSWSLRRRDDVRSQTERRTSERDPLLERHLIGEELPAELGLVVNEGDPARRRRGTREESTSASALRHTARIKHALGDGLVLLGGLGRELLRDLLGGVLELLKEGRGDSEVVDTSKSLDLASVAEAGLV